MEISELNTFKPRERTILLFNFEPLSDQCGRFRRFSRAQVTLSIDKPRLNIINFQKESIFMPF